jgi:hypothetical protein
MGSLNDEEDAMRWPLFTWILAGGILGMFWFVYLSIKQHETGGRLPHTLDRIGAISTETALLQTPDR